MRRLVSTACIAAAFLLSTSAFAQQPKNKATPPKTKKAKPVAAEEDSGEDASSGNSASVRQTKKFGFNVGGGAIVGGVSGVDVEGYYLISPKFAIGGAYMSGSADLGTLSDDQFETTDFGLDAQMMLVRARFYLGNSFNISALLGQRIITAHATIKSKTSSDELKLTMNSSSTMLGVTIGNHWSFGSGFTIGCDWVGYYYPLASSASSKTETKGTVSAAADELAEEVQDSSESLGKTPNDQLLVFTLGWAF